ncbi:MAG: MFS transporter, partial [Acidobacteriota bacterium]|nr:MFS transporter [Acidobacteriota bacterium]
AAELRGRVMGAWSVALPGTLPITALIAGAVADALGVRVAYAAAGAIIGGVALMCWRAYEQAPLDSAPGQGPVDKQRSC